MGRTSTEDIQAQKEKMRTTAAEGERVARKVLTWMAVEQIYIDAGLEKPWSTKGRLHAFKIKMRCNRLLFASRMLRGCATILDEMEIYENAPEYLGEKR